MQGIRRINKPILLWSGSVIEGDPATGLFALKGALDAVDIDYKAVYGNPDEKSTINEVLTICFPIIFSSLQLSVSSPFHIS
jgi:hypothetical protein